MGWSGWGAAATAHPCTTLGASWFLESAARDQAEAGLQNAGRRRTTGLQSVAGGDKLRRRAAP